MHKKPASHDHPTARNRDSIGEPAKNRADAEQQRDGECAEASGPVHPGFRQRAHEVTCGSGERDEQQHRQGENSTLPAHAENGSFDLYYCLRLPVHVIYCAVSSCGQG